MQYHQCNTGEYCTHVDQSDHVIKFEVVTSTRMQEPFVSLYL